jgi:septum formation protein
MKGRLILASASACRRQLLSQIGVFPNDVIPSKIDESPEVKEIPSKQAIRLAQQKASKVAHNFIGNFVLGADTLVACGRKEVPKAMNENQAIRNLELLSGKRHKVFGGIALVLPNRKMISRLVITIVEFKRLSKDEIKNYIKSEEWYGKAGAYAIQGSAQMFIKRINGSFSNVMGLSLYETMSLLKGNGYLEGKFENGG